MLEQAAYIAEVVVQYIIITLTRYSKYFLTVAGKFHDYLTMYVMWLGFVYGHVHKADLSIEN